MPSRQSKRLLDKKKKQFEYEFMGPLGTGILILVLPITCYTLYGICNSKNSCFVGCATWGSAWNDILQFLLYPYRVASLTKYLGFKFTSNIFSLSAVAERFETAFPTVWSWQALTVFLCWMGFQVLLHGLVPGTYVSGVKLLTGKALMYKINGFRCFLVTFAVLGASTWMSGPWLWLWIADNFLPLMTAAILFSLVLSLSLYIASFRDPAPLLALGGASGNAVYDFFMGRELNPRIKLLNFELDLKFFCELRPGLIGWVVFNVAFAVKQYVTFNLVSAPMVLILVFQTWYVIDALFCEPYVLSTMDITSDGFGMMLVFGDLVWVPFTYSLQARYLSFKFVQFGIPGLALILFVHAVGFYIFRSANLQKHLFKTDPKHSSVARLKYISALGGKRRLLADGWWAMSRHINYFGDWLMGLSWCMCCGYESAIPYFYAIYFAILLAHRQLRDDEKCRKKYGADWEKYCELVPFKIIPFIY